MKINIHEYITLKGKDEWLVYQVDRIDFTSDNKAKKKAYCFSVKGKFNIFLSKDILAVSYTHLTLPTNREV